MADSVGGKTAFSGEDNAGPQPGPVWVTVTLGISAHAVTAEVKAGAYGKSLSEAITDAMCQIMKMTDVIGGSRGPDTPEVARD